MFNAILIILLRPLGARKQANPVSVGSILPNFNEQSDVLTESVNLFSGGCYSHRQVRQTGFLCSSGVFALVVSLCARVACATAGGGEHDPRRNRPPIVRKTHAYSRLKKRRLLTLFRLYG